jgi:glycosyltransferase involved in cell wall biosynthesis
MNPRVSVIVPCYNYGNYIEKCIMSVLLQKLDFDIEILVGDDNSTDDSFNIVKRLKNFYEDERIKFKIIKHEPNVGEINNTKSLLDSAEGEYIAYLDADDFWIDPLKMSK